MLPLINMNVLFFFFFRILFVFYSQLPDNSIKKLKSNLDLSLLFSFFIYFFAGLFGYIAFCNTKIHGNILTNLPPTFMTEVLAFGFVLMVLIGFPFGVFPCRNSVNSLLFSEVTYILLGYYLNLIFMVLSY